MLKPLTFMRYVSMWGEKEKSPAPTYNKRVQMRGICGKTIDVPWEIISFIDAWILLKSALFFIIILIDKSYTITDNILKIQVVV